MMNFWSLISRYYFAFTASSFITRGVSIVKRPSIQRQKKRDMEDFKPLKNRLC